MSHDLAVKIQLGLEELATIRGEFKILISTTSDASAEISLIDPVVPRQGGIIVPPPSTNYTPKIERHADLLGWIPVSNVLRLVQYTPLLRALYSNPLVVS